MSDLNTKSTTGKKNVMNILQKITSMANTVGGIIIFGIDDKTRKLEKGVKVNIEAISQKISNYIKDYVLPGLELGYETFIVENNQILVIEIPQRSNIPYAITGKLVSDKTNAFAVYLRQGESSYPLKYNDFINFVSDFDFPTINEVSRVSIVYNTKEIVEGNLEILFRKFQNDFRKQLNRTLGYETLLHVISCSSYNKLKDKIIEILKKEKYGVGFYKLSDKIFSELVIYSLIQFIFDDFYIKWNMGPKPSGSGSVQGPLGFEYKEYDLRDLLPIPPSESILKEIGYKYENLFYSYRTARFPEDTKFEILLRDGNKVLKMSSDDKYQIEFKVKMDSERTGIDISDPINYFLYNNSGFDPKDYSDEEVNKFKLEIEHNFNTILGYIEINGFVNLSANSPVYSNYYEWLKKISNRIVEAFDYQKIYDNLQKDQINRIEAKIDKVFRVINNKSDERVILDKLRDKLF